jgi:hypothetical protein
MDFPDIPIDVALLQRPEDHVEDTLEKASESQDIGRVEPKALWNDASNPWIVLVWVGLGVLLSVLAIGFLKSRTH